MTMKKRKSGAAMSVRQNSNDTTELKFSFIKLVKVTFSGMVSLELFENEEDVKLQVAQE